jgi:hypothetical protein
MKNPRKQDKEKIPAARHKVSFFSAAVIACAARSCKRTIHRRAKIEAWPQAPARGNFIEYQPPRDLREKCVRIFFRSKPSGLRDFQISPPLRAEEFRAHTRFQALCSLDAALKSGSNFERALKQVARDFTMHVSPNSLRRWKQKFSIFGMAGLLEHKRGNSGRRKK